MSKIIYRSVFILGSILLIAGSVFKMQHWVGSKVLLLTGFGLIGFLFTPVYFSYKLKKHSTKLLKWLDFIAILCLFALSVGSMLKILNFKSGYYIMWIGFIVLVLLFIPLLTYVIVKDKANRVKRILVLCFSIIYALLAINFIIDSIISIKSAILNSFVLVDRGIEMESKKSLQQSDYTYLLASHKDRIKILRLKQKSDSLYDYLQALKIEIVTDCANNNSLDDSLLYDKLFIKKKASEVKYRIDSYKNFVIHDLADYINTETIDKDMDIKVYNAKAGKSWEDEHFNHLPAIAVTTILSKLQSNVRNVENYIIVNLKK